MPRLTAAPTPITPPRVPIIDPRTGLIDRAWYMFFLSLMTIAGEFAEDIAPNVSALVATYDTVTQNALQSLQVIPASACNCTQLADAPDPVATGSALSQLTELQNQIDALSMAPATEQERFTRYSIATTPVTKTADFSVADDEVWYINNKSGSTCTVSLPLASEWPGREITFKTVQPQTLVSALSDVVPITDTVAGSAILPAIIGAWATLVSDGTNWVIMQSRYAY